MSTFVVSARKYRPSRFEDVVGQEHVTNTLKNALRNDHLAHAFLFCGPRGVGKTTCARILAKVLNCHSPNSDFEPCNECDSCRSFNENASFNITELDAASNNSVEHIRALIEQVRFQPQQGKYKVFIIDEVHMLSQQAFNAFLKTLEEPPPYAIFILATTEKHKIIPTILSRCQIFDFKRIQVPAMVAHLAHICQTEGIQADAEALHIIAQKADGALRDSLSIFDRIVSFSGKQIKYEDVISNLNVLDYDFFFRTVSAMLSEDRSQVLLILDEVMKKGFDPDLFINGLASHLRDLLVCQDEATIALLEVGESLRDRYLQQARQANPSFLLTAMNLANDCDLNYKSALNKRLHVEMALLKMTYTQRAVDLARHGAPAEIPEKKTPDLSQSPSTTAANDRQKSEKSNPDSVSKQQTAEESAKTTEPLAQAEDDPLESTTAGHTETPNESPTSERLSNTPRLGDIGVMMERLKQQEANVQTEQQKEPLTLDGVQAFYQRHLENIPQESTRNLLKSVTFVLDHQELKATVSSTLVENALRQEHNLIQDMRENFGAPDLRLRIEVDKSQVREAPKRPTLLSNKEKLRQMYEQNPNIKDLTDRFGLRFDD